MEEKEKKKTNKKESDIEKLKKELKEELKKEVLDEMKEEKKEDNKEEKNFEEKAKETIDKIMDTEDSTKDYDKKDIDDNKGMAILSYFGPLCLIPYLSSKDSKFVQFHAKQGLNLFVIELIVSAISYFIYSIVKIPKMCTLLDGSLYECGTFTPWWISLPIELVEVIIFIIAIIGIVFASQGKAKELPIIEKIKIIK